MSTQTPAQLTIGVLKILAETRTGEIVAQTVSRTVIAHGCNEAWDNGWRDARALATAALVGTSSANVKSPAALFTSQLRGAAAEGPYTGDVTELPPRFVAEPRRDDQDDINARGLALLRAAWQATKESV